MLKLSYCLLAWNLVTFGDLEQTQGHQ